MVTLSFISMLIGVDKWSRRRQRHLDISSLPWSDTTIVASQEQEPTSQPVLEAVQTQQKDKSQTPNIPGDRILNTPVLFYRFARHFLCPWNIQHKDRGVSTAYASRTTAVVPQDCLQQAALPTWERTLGFLWSDSSPPSSVSAGTSILVQVRTEQPDEGKMQVITS